MENKEFIFKDINKAEMKMEELLYSDLHKNVKEVNLYGNKTKTLFKVVVTYNN